MKKLSIRKRAQFQWEVGPTGIGPTKVVSARSKPEALVEAKKWLKDERVRASIRASVGITRRKTI